MRELYPGDPATCWNRSTCRMRKASTSISAQPIVRVRSPWDRCAQRRGSSSRTAARNAALARRVSRSLHRGGAAVCHRPGALPALRAVPGDVLLRCDRPPFVTELDEPTRSSWLRRNARFGRNMPPMPIWPSEFVSSEPQGFPPSGLMEAITQSPQAEARSEFVMGCDLRTNAEAALVGTGARLRPATGSG